MLTTEYVPGSPVWIELGVHDIEAAAVFYGELLGWEFMSAGPEAGGYGFFRLDGRTVAAVGPLPDGSASSSWSVYFHTRDADATAKAVEQAGGTVTVPPMDIFDHGRAAHFTDSAGAGFGVWQPDTLQGLDVVNEPGTLCWTELYTTDSAVAKQFYTSVFGWDFEDAPLEDVSYAVASPSGTGQDGSHGGIMQLPPGGPGAGTVSWHPYFEVEDCDAAFATATDRGATALMPPEDAPGIGRMSMLFDPFGAPFALITSSAE